MVAHKNKVIRFFIWLFWDFPGFRLIWSKIVPPILGKDESKRPPSTFIIWFISIYLGTFTLASSIFVYKKNIVGSKINNLISIIASSPNNKYAFNRLAEIQKVGIPIEPSFLKPYNTLKTLFGPNVINDKIVDIIKEVFVDNKYNLNDTKLYGIDLSNCHLNYANFENSKLHRANFQNSLLANVNFSKCILEKSNFQNSFLAGSKFIDSSLMYSNLRNAKFDKVLFNNCDLRYADLRLDEEELKSSFLNAEQLASAYSLTGIQCPEKIFNILKTKHSELFSNNKKLKEGTVEIFGAVEW